MKYTGAVALSLLLLAVTACTTLTPQTEPKGMKLELRSDRESYEVGDDFEGTLTITNTMPTEVNFTTGTTELFFIDFYDADDCAEYGYPEVCGYTQTRHTFAPGEVRVETLAFLLKRWDHEDENAPLPAGTHRMHAFVDIDNGAFDDLTIRIVAR